MTKIGVGQVIKGWDEGVPQLSLGEKAILTCSPDYAYGARGYPPIIPGEPTRPVPPRDARSADGARALAANSTLKFEVELLKASPSSPRRGSRSLTLHQIN